jgi:hypothetical protein
VTHVVNATGKGEIPYSALSPEQPGIEAFSRLSHDFELDRPPGLLLNHGCPFAHAPVANEVTHSKFDEVTSPKFAVDGNIEEGSIPEAPMLIQKEPNGPNVSRAERTLRTDILPGVPRPSFMDRRI